MFFRTKQLQEQLEQITIQKISRNEQEKFFLGIILPSIRTSHGADKISIHTSEGFMRGEALEKNQPAYDNF